MCNMPRVLFRLGPQSLEQELPIGTELAIGRDDSASSIQLTHSTADSKQQLLAPVRTLSQQHAVLRVIDSDRVQIEDCGSKNGTFLRLKPGTSLEIGEDNELLFGRELTIRLTGQPFGRERIQSAADVERPDELVKYLRAQLGSSADRIYLTTREAAERAGASRQLLRLPLSDDKQIIVKWQGSTLDVEAENWLRAAVSLYNSRRSDDSGNHKSWEFTAVSAARKQALWLARRVAPSHCTVLIRGATGTGKEVLANDLHNHSLRASRPFVALNCGAIQANLAESQLFGHLRGSFTGATDSREGVFEQADGGTLFLDEIGELPLDIQVKLLRVLETRRITPVGASKDRQVDVRVIAATHRPLEDMIEQGTFREDLYYRLSTIQIQIPRPEAEDIEELAQLFLERLCQVREVTLKADELAKIASLAARHPFPGGIRELRSALERYTLLRTDHHTPEENWRVCVQGNTPSGVLNRRSSKPDSESAPLVIPSIPKAKETPETIPERASLSISKQIDNLMFLSILLDAVESDPRVGISKIAGRVNMTYQWVVNRLKSLDLRLDGPDMLQRIRSRMDEERAQIQPYHSWLSHCLRLG